MRFPVQESILVSSSTVYNVLKERAPEALEILAQQDFWWEFRGFSPLGQFYRAPILYFNRMGEPCFRFLRDYMESAHDRLGDPHTPEQRWALDALTTSMEAISAIQFRFDSGPGHMLFANDVQILHGRTSFMDANAATSEYDFSNPVNRLFQRNWIRTSSSFENMNDAPFTVPDDEEIRRIIAQRHALRH